MQFENQEHNEKHEIPWRRDFKEILSRITTPIHLPDYIKENLSMAQSFFNSAPLHGLSSVLQLVTRIQGPLGPSLNTIYKSMHGQMLDYLNSPWMQAMKDFDTVFNIVDVPDLIKTAIENEELIKKFRESAQKDLITKINFSLTPYTINRPCRLYCCTCARLNCGNFASRGASTGVPAIQMRDEPVTALLQDRSAATQKTSAVAAAKLFDITQIWPSGLNLESIHELQLIVSKEQDGFKMRVFILGKDSRGLSLAQFRFIDNRSHVRPIKAWFTLYKFAERRGGKIKFNKNEISLLNKKLKVILNIDFNSIISVGGGYYEPMFKCRISN